MRMLSLLLLCLWPTLSAAQTVLPNAFPQGGMITSIPTSPGITLQYDQRGNSATIIDHGAGLSFYTQQNSTGQVTGQGFVVNPFAPPSPPLGGPSQIPSAFR